ncbi:MAG: tripartite tricarboxylate transporter TctB family protein [Betaproteobacteria bacterium]|nr:tripartite tricarboxylate transporter TctB family protein [Betaproteobacteria bacterium]
MTARSPIHLGEMLISFALIALGSFVVLETRSIAETQGYAQIGPRLFPYIIGVGLTLCGAVLGWHALTGGWRNIPLDQEGHGAPDWLAFFIISAGIVLHMVVIGWAGFIIASTLLFVLIARGFGSRRLVRDALIAVALAAVVFFVFTSGLGLKLPSGPF